MPRVEGCYVGPVEVRKHITEHGVEAGVLEGRFVGVAEKGHCVALVCDARHAEFDVAEGGRCVVPFGGEGEGNRKGAMDFTPLVWLRSRRCHERAVAPGYEGEEESARWRGV